MIYSAARDAKRRGRLVKRRLLHIARSICDPSPKFLILVYHRVLPEVVFNPLSTIISLKSFERQLDHVAKRYSIISLRDAASQISEGNAARGTQVILTFDDGYRDNCQIAFPALRKKGLPATFFLSTDYIGSERPLWDWEIISRITASGGIDSIDIGGNIISKGDSEPSLSYAFRIFRAMKSADKGDLARVLDYLRTKAPLGGDQKADSCMGWDEVMTIAGNGMEIGSHGLTHRSLAKLPRHEASEEILLSKETIEGRTGEACRYFSFPFGSALDYNEDLIGIVRDAGYGACLLNIHGYNRLSDGLFSLKRIIMDEDTPINYLFG